MPAYLLGRKKVPPRAHHGSGDATEAAIHAVDGVADWAATPGATACRRL